MSRPLRVEYPGAIYFITSKTPDSVIAFHDDRDRVRFLDILAKTVKRSQWICHGYCLMQDHYQLIIETPKANLSQGMRQVNGIYTQEYNRRYFKKGALFKGRFKAILFDKNQNLLSLARHMVLTPVRQNEADYASQYPWSSYKATAGIADADEDSIITREWILAQLSESQNEAQKRYQDYVNDSKEFSDPFRNVRYQLLLGDKSFVERHRRFLGEPQQPRAIDRLPLEQLFNESSIASRTERDRNICEAHLQHGYTLTEVGRHLGLHTSTVSKILKKKGV